MPAPAVLFRSVVALVDHFPVLAGVDLSIDRGESVLLTGANGAGKTSVLRTIAGLIRIDQGEASVLGHDLARDRRPVRRRVGLLGHSTFLYGDLTVEENLRFATRAAGVSPSGVTAALSQVGLAGRLAGVTVDRLSAGQRRRAALAALVARDPELWLLDEPHAGLDAEGRDVIDTLIVDACSRGRTVVMSSHETERAAGVATRRVEMAGGAANVGEQRVDLEARVPTDVA